MLSAIPGALGIRLEEEPRHEVLDRIGEVEIRRYAPALLAQVSVDGTEEAAMDRAFEKLAGYLYGNNADDEKMHMTIPVYQRDSGDARVPVTARGQGEGWTVAFFLGNDRAPGNLPTPSDPGITMLELPAFLAAVLQCRGNNTPADRAQARDALLATLRDAKHWGAGRRSVLGAVRPAVRDSLPQAQRGAGGRAGALTGQRLCRAVAR